MTASAAAPRRSYRGILRPPSGKHAYSSSSRRSPALRPRGSDCAIHLYEGASHSTRLRSRGGRWREPCRWHGVNGDSVWHTQSWWMCACAVACDTTLLWVSRGDQCRCGWALQLTGRQPVVVSVLLRPDWDVGAVRSARVPWCASSRSCRSDCPVVRCPDCFCYCRGRCDPSLLLWLR